MSVRIEELWGPCAEADLAASIAAAPDDLRAALARLGRVALSRSDIGGD